MHYGEMMIDCFYYLCFNFIFDYLQQNLSIVAISLIVSELLNENIYVSEDDLGKGIKYQSDHNERSWLVQV